MDSPTIRGNMDALTAMAASEPAWLRGGQSQAKDSADADSELAAARHDAGLLGRWGACVGLWVPVDQRTDRGVCVRCSDCKKKKEGGGCQKKKVEKKKKKKVCLRVQLRAWARVRATTDADPSRAVSANRAQDASCYTPSHLLLVYFGLRLHIH